MFLSNGDFENGGQADWSIGLGTLSVYIDDLYTPLFVVPMNLGSTLKLDNGRAWVGFTSATGENQWQVYILYIYTYKYMYIYIIYIYIYTYIYMYTGT